LLSSLFESSDLISQFLFWFIILYFFVLYIIIIFLYNNMHALTEFLLF
jgi:hypothetical protein